MIFSTGACRACDYSRILQALRPPCCFACLCLFPSSVCMCKLVVCSDQAGSSMFPEGSERLGEASVRYSKIM